MPRQLQGELQGPTGFPTGGDDGYGGYDGFNADDDHVEHDVPGAPGGHRSVRSEGSVGYDYQEDGYAAFDGGAVNDPDWSGATSTAASGHGSGAALPPPSSVRAAGWRPNQHPAYFDGAPGAPGDSVSSALERPNRSHVEAYRRGMNCMAVELVAAAWGSVGDQVQAARDLTRRRNGGLGRPSDEVDLHLQALAAAMAAANAVAAAAVAARW